LVHENIVAQGKSGNHHVLNIDIEALLGVQAQNDDGLTTAEWAGHLGVSEEKMRKVLAYGVPKGLFVQGSRVGPHYTGRMVRFIVYRYVGGEHEPKLP
jgi:hypothetical protein